MYSLSPSPWPRLPLLCILNIRQLEFHWITLLTCLVLFVFVFLKRYLLLLFVVDCSFFFFVAPSLAVFQSASAFNQDVSKWNTGAVTNMAYSKCTLSFSRLPLLCILNMRQLEFHQINILTRYVIVDSVCLKRYSFLLFVVG